MFEYNKHSCLEQVVLTIPILHENWTTARSGKESLPQTQALNSVGAEGGTLATQGSGEEKKHSKGECPWQSPCEPVSCSSVSWASLIAIRIPLFVGKESTEARRTKMSWNDENTEERYSAFLRWGRGRTVGPGSLCCLVKDVKGPMIFRNFCLSQRSHRNKGQCYHKELPEIHKNIQRAPVQKPFEILCSSQKWQFLFVGKVCVTGATHTTPFRPATVEALTMARDGNVHTIIPNRWAAESYTTERKSGSSPESTLSWRMLRKDKSSPSSMQILEPTQGWNMWLQFHSLQNIPIWCLKTKTSS